jgi:hypothetical protein
MNLEKKPSKELSERIEKFWLMPRKGGEGWWKLEAPPDGNFDLVFIRIALQSDLCGSLH